MALIAISNAIKTRWKPLFWKDAIAGLSIAGLLLPEAVAYSNIANMPPQTGIIALFAGLICFSIFGQSRFAIVTATSSSAALLGASIASIRIKSYCWHSGW
jgi:MFS superfamily sulfate permease-like transporter